eukprot:340610_1
MEVIKRHIWILIVMLAIDTQWNKAQIWRYSQCLGSNACSGAVLSGINATTYAKCTGDRSCANAHLSGFKHYSFHGAYSAFNATIHSVLSTTIELWGYGAGYGAKIYCNISHQCTIYCEGNACSKTQVQCDGNCNIQTSEDSIPPITNVSILEASHFNYSMLYDSSIAIMTMNNDANCNQQPNQSNVFNASCYGDVQIRNDYGRPACFRGQIATTCGTNNISVYTDTLRSIVCSGERSCLSYKIYAKNASICCEELESCLGTEMHTSGDVYCFGDSSCVESTIYDARNVYCTAYFSCYHGIFHATRNISIYFLGMYAGLSSDIWCYPNTRCNIICDGYLACVDVRAHCHGLCVIECDSSSGCPIQHSWDPTTDPTSAPTIEPTWLPTITSTTDTTNDTMMEHTIDLTPDAPTKENEFTAIIIAALVVTAFIVAGFILVCYTFFRTKHRNKNEQQIIQKEIQNNQRTVQKEDLKQFVDEKSEGGPTVEVDNDNAMPYTDEGPPANHQSIGENMKSEGSNSDFAHNVEMNATPLNDNDLLGSTKTSSGNKVELAGTSDDNYTTKGESDGDNIGHDEFVIKGDDQIN